MKTQTLQIIEIVVVVFSNNSTSMKNFLRKCSDKVVRKILLFLGGPHSTICSIIIAVNFKTLEWIIGCHRLHAIPKNFFTLSASLFYVHT